MFYALAVEKSRKHVHIFQYSFTANVFHSNPFSWEALPEATYFQMGVGRQIHIIFEVLDMKNIDHHSHRNLSISEKCHDLEGILRIWSRATLLDLIRFHKCLLNPDFAHISSIFQK